MTFFCCCNAVKFLSGKTASWFDQRLENTLSKGRVPRVHADTFSLIFMLVITNIAAPPSKKQKQKHFQFVILWYYLLYYRYAHLLCRRYMRNNRPIQSLFKWKWIEASTIWIWNYLVCSCVCAFSTCGPFVWITCVMTGGVCGGWGGRDFIGS